MAWQKKASHIFEGGLIPQGTLCVILMVDMFKSGKLVTCHLFFSQYHALLVMHSIGNYIFKLHMFSEVSLNPKLQDFEFCASGNIICSEKSFPYFFFLKSEFAISSLLGVYKLWNSFFSGSVLRLHSIQL